MCFKFVVETWHRGLGPHFGREFVPLRAAVTKDLDPDLVFTGIGFYIILLHLRNEMTTYRFCPYNLHKDGCLTMSQNSIQKTQSLFCLIPSHKCHRLADTFPVLCPADTVRNLGVNFNYDFSIPNIIQVRRRACFIQLWDREVLSCFSIILHIIPYVVGLTESSFLYLNFVHLFINPKTILVIVSLWCS